MDSKKGHDFTHCNDNGRRSFSGFSQGSIENDYSNEVTDDQDDQEGSEIRVRDSNDSNTSPKESFFKEVISLSINRLMITGAATRCNIYLNVGFVIFFFITFIFFFIFLINIYLF